MDARVLAQVDQLHRSGDPGEQRLDDRLVVAGEREHRAVVIGVRVDVQEGRVRREGVGDRPHDARISPLGDVGHSLEHDPYPTKPCLRTTPEAPRGAAGARSAGCSDSCARTAFPLPSRRFLAIASQVAGIFVPVLTGVVINEIDGSPDTQVLMLEIGAIVALGLLRGALMYGRRVISGRQALAVEYDMRDELYSHFLRLSFGFYDRSQTGQLMSRATIDLQSVRFFLGYGLIFFAQHVVTIVVVTARPVRLQLGAGARRARDHAGDRAGRVPLQPCVAARAP